MDNIFLKEAQPIYSFVKPHWNYIAQTMDISSFLKNNNLIRSQLTIYKTKTVVPTLEAVPVMKQELYNSWWNSYITTYTISGEQTRAIAKK